MRRQQWRDAGSQGAWILLTACIALGLARSPVRVVAQDAPPSSADTARARALFDQGLALADQTEWAQAAARFREALALRPAPAIRYNLAAALVELGQHAAAGEQLDLTLADPSTSAEIRSRATELLARVGTHTGRLSVRVAGGTEAARGVTVTIDGQALPASRIGSAVRVSVGSHVVIASRGARQVARAERTVAAGESAELTLEIAPTPVEVARRQQPRPPAGGRPSGAVETHDERAGGDREGGMPAWPIWVGAGVGAVVLVTVVVVVAASGQVQDPVSGDLEPGVLRVR